MGGYERDELLRGDEFGLFPEPGKVPKIAGDQVVGARLVRALEENVVARVARGLDRAGRQ